MTVPTQSAATAPWRDPAAPTAHRVAALVDDLTLEEKVAQLVGLWVGANAETGDVAPQQSEMTGDPVAWSDAIRYGLGQLTRPLGTVPVAPQVGAEALARSQRQIQAASRHGIPALVHEECLAGYAAWQATAYPVPPSWGATFDPELVAEMAQQIGSTMRSAGIHQGLAPVLDVTRDYRWGRTEETISEDPYLVAAVGAAYVRGLESSGIIATLKHFPGYSASRAGRNLAPVSVGPRELADVILPPFEAALRHGGARSVMHSYTDIDGVPTAADNALLTELLRGQWQFTGTVVADYFGVRFLQTLHRVAENAGDAAVLALQAGVDVELPSGDAYLEPLLTQIRTGQVPEALLDRALTRVLTQKVELGLLDPDWDPEPVAPVVLDDADGQALALRVARQAVTVVANDGVLPLAEDAHLAIVGPLADEAAAMLGCYSFPAHVGARYAEYPIGIEIPTLRTELARRRQVTFTSGGDTIAGDDADIEAAVVTAASADVCVLAVGDRAGLFGRGTSGEGCDAADLRLPGAQQALVDAVLATGTRVVLVVLSGRPYALGAAIEQAAAIVQAFFPGQLGGKALAEVLTGEVEPSGRLPMSVPSRPGGGPGTYLSAPLGHASGVSNIDPTPAFSFGHGLSYTTFEWSQVELVSGPEWDTVGTATLRLRVRNTGARRGTEVVQLYLHDQAAQVTRPVVQLIGFARVPLEPGAAAMITFDVPADVTSFTGRDLRRIVEPGAMELRLARSAGQVLATVPITLTGDLREVGHHREMFTGVTLEEEP